MEITIELLKTFSPEETKAINLLLSQLTPDAKILSDDEIRKISQDPTNHFFVARDTKDNKIVGMAIIVIVSTLLRRKALLEELVVDENYRGQGIGEKIVKFVVDQARLAGAVHFDFTSNPARTEANKLYQSLGFTKRDTNVYRMDL